VNTRRKNRPAFAISQALAESRPIVQRGPKPGKCTSRDEMIVLAEPEERITQFAAFSSRSTPR
jgi:hypothetical protein